MTKQMDKFFIKIGLDSQEIQSNPKRGILYIGMIYMFGIATAFLIMTILT
jgi:hypothetical protein